MRVALLLVGDELLSGEIEDRNGPVFLARMAEVGVQVSRVVMVGDVAESLCEELVRLQQICDAVVVSGGLGPTHDDCTRASIAAALGVGLERNPEAEARIRGYYGERTTEAELTMADAPEGARIFEGLRSRTFGYEVQQVFMFPGVPALFADLVESLVGRIAGTPLARGELRSRSREGELAPLLARVQADAPEVTIGSYPELEDGNWSVRVVVRSASVERVSEVLALLRRELG